MASFIVPLSFNKLDLKDYLWHAYKIPVLSVRSYVLQQKVRPDKPGTVDPMPRKWYRERSTKRMIVEMGEGEHGGPFVWPDEIKDFAEWDKEQYDMIEEEQDFSQDALRRRQYGLVKKKDGATLAEQAKKLLEGKEAWKPSWVEFGQGRGEKRRANTEAALEVDAAKADKKDGGDGGGETTIPIPVVLPV